MSNYPTTSIDFIIASLLNCDKIRPDSRMSIGANTITFVLAGNKPMHKRFIVINHSNGLVNFNQSTALAIRFGFMGSLLHYFEKEHSWKEGAYIVAERDNQEEE